MKNLWRLLKNLAPYKFWLIYGLLLALLRSVSTVLASLSIANILNTIVGQGTTSFLMSCLIPAGYFLIASIATYLYDCNTTRVKEAYARDLRQKHLDAIVQSHYAQFSGKQPDEYAAMLITDVDMLSNRILNNLFRIVSNTLIFISSVVGLIYLHVSLVILAVVLALSMLFIPALFQNKMQALSQQVADKSNQLLAHAGHWIKGFQFLNDVNHKQAIHERVMPTVDTLSQSKIEDGRFSALVSLVSEAIGVVAQMSMIIVTGILALNGVVSPGTILSTGNLSGMIFGTLGLIIALISQFQSGFVHMDKLEKVVSDLHVSSVGESKANLVSPFVIQSEGLVKKFSDGRSLAYPNLLFSGCKSYALVGKSGVGKSVLLNLILKNMSGYQGSLTLNHLEIEALSETSLKQYIAYVPQITYLFNATIKDNILMANPNASESLYQQIIDTVGLRETFETWDKGDQTVYEEHMTTISGGQAQRIGIARALIQEKPILLFDEITANLDHETAISIEKSISQIQNCLKISVTHHLNDHNRGFYDEVVQL